MPHLLLRPDAHAQVHIPPRAYSNLSTGQYRPLPFGSASAMESDADSDAEATRSEAKHNKAKTAAAQTDEGKAIKKKATVLTWVLDTVSTAFGGFVKPELSLTAASATAVFHSRFRFY